MSPPKHSAAAHTERVDAIHRTGCELKELRLERARQARSDRGAMRERRLVAAALALKPVELSPYERAVKRIERLTGRRRSTWEFVAGHPLARAATKAGLILAGMQS